ncbi:hypothetical protein EYC80_011026 [Monilinia laxa]|uniref:Uncharacterized protein n=1 Tax=Monilinia laxa TaxID=61186 RepID=A0A5N6JNR5_MONLA|nr:hypothetical protein EYC80_011026 [Monilinia laxa]
MTFLSLVPEPVPIKVPMPPVLAPEAHNPRVTIVRAPQDFVDAAASQETPHARPADAPALVRPEFRPQDPIGLDLLLIGFRHAIGVWQIVITTGRLTESWAELASRKHKEWTAPAPSSPTLPDPVQESWVEMTSRKHKELKVVEASKEKDLAEIAPVTPTKPREARFLKERARLREIEGLDIQSQVSSLIYARKVKAGALVPFKKVGTTMEAKKKDIPSSPSVKVLPQRSRVHSKEPTSVLEQATQRPKQSLLGSFPIQDFSENSSTPAEPRQTISPSKVRINTETLISRIQELRRASFASEKPKPIQNIMDESFDDYDFASEYNDVEPVVPTHWQD